MGRTLTAFFLPCLALITSTVASGLAVADHCKCDRCGSACQHGELVECTVYVPVTVVETRMKSRVVKNVEQREEKYTAFKRVPVTRSVTKEHCYMDDEVRTKKITEKKCHLVRNPVVRTIHVNRYVPEMREYSVTREICTDCGKICVEEPCQCMVMRKQPDIVSENCEEVDVVFETREREISYCVKVPKKEEIPCYEETVYKLQPVEQTRMVEVCVPEVIKEPCEVMVRKMIPKKILCCRTCSKHHH